ncbi:NifU family protein [Cytophagia bacterium]|nr:NifU family protein [Cytophagia bacterium]MDC3054266.1 NifU family protein [Cytophagia bacterium]MEC7260301.1 NifU family protein [Bacteroidota bacterium]|tara:strand:- start:304 stop:555 length:252 start_codon:yes stop_codon:yes gene_type:complete
MSDQSLIEKVEIAIDEIRPYLIADGGDIKVVSIDNKNIVNLELLGSCETCPMSPMTLKAGVEEAIKKQVPEIKGINAINGVIN